MLKAGSVLAQIVILVVLLVAVSAIIRAYETFVPAVVQRILNVLAYF